MLVQAVGLGLLAASRGSFAPALGAAARLGGGTAHVYPTRSAAGSDVVEPRARAAGRGVYRFWRDTGFVVGGLCGGLAADALGAGVSIALVAALTAASGLGVAATDFASGDGSHRQRALGR
jgi:hypothetical protein